MLLTTPAIVLHAFPYLESSRILRLATREAGVQSVLAKGARKARGPARMTLDLFVEGTAQVWLKPGRDLHTLGGFDLARTRPALGADLGRFAAANALGELMLRAVSDEAQPDVYDAFVHALDAIAEASGEGAVTAGLGGTWQLVATLGFAPALEACAVCLTPVPPDADAAFSHAAGGVLCPRCAGERGGRRLPAAARDRIRGWVEGAGPGPGLDAPTARAHLRLLREFVAQHLHDGRPLKAFDAWERQPLGG